MSRRHVELLMDFQPGEPPLDVNLWRHRDGRPFTRRDVAVVLTARPEDWDLLRQLTQLELDLIEERLVALAYRMGWLPE